MLNQERKRGQSMTAKEWKTAARVLNSGKDYTAKNGAEICKYAGAYGVEYSLHVPGVGCVMVDCDLLKIKEILVD